MKRNPANREQARVTLRVLLIVTACASLLAPFAFAAKKNASEPPPRAIYWPEPPDEPRVAWVQNVLQPSDLGAKVSGVRRTVNWFAGDSKGNERFSSPFGIALDEEDNLCLTDTGLKTASVFIRAQKKWLRWERIGDIRFNSPVAIVKRSDLIFVADSGLGRIIAFSSDGKLRFQISENLQRPSGLAIQGEQLLVADSQRHEVLIFDLRGKFVSSFGKRGTASGEFNYPTHLATDRKGNIYVTDSMNSRVQVFDASGTFRTQIGAPGDGPGYFNRPKGVAVDRFGHLYVLDAMFDNIQVFDASGRLLLDLGHGGSEPGEFWLPNGIAIGSDNRIYVTDSFNKRIQVLQYIGKEN
jgi:DNA-binding beta-propeller fold protein YncE